MLNGIFRARGRIDAMEKFAIDAATLRKFIEQGLDHDQLKAHMAAEYPNHPPVQFPPAAPVMEPTLGSPRSRAGITASVPNHLRVPTAPPAPLGGAQLGSMSTDQVLQHFGDPRANRPAAPPMESMHTGSAVGPTAGTFVGRR